MSNVLSAERDPNGYIYDGQRLVLVAFDSALVEHFRNNTGYTVSETPLGDAS